MERPQVWFRAPLPCFLLWGMITSSPPQAVQVSYIDVLETELYKEFLW